MCEAGKNYLIVLTSWRHVNLAKL